jgi:uncharacterized protein (DUF1330 family)
MPKGYWLPQIDVSNPDGYKAYMAATPPAHEKYNGVALVRGGRSEVVEGRSRSRVVIREFPDYAAALACYRSPEYQSARSLRLAHAQSDFVIAEGYNGIQPVQSRSISAGGEAKGYWIAYVDVTNPNGFAAYQVPLMPSVGRFGGRFLVRSGAREVVEGAVRGRTVVIEFPSYDVARECYRSNEYQAAKKLRDGNADVDLVIIEGYGGPKF